VSWKHGRGVAVSVYSELILAPDGGFWSMLYALAEAIYTWEEIGLVPVTGLVGFC
jgi:hypothetical protein